MPHPCRTRWRLDGTLRFAIDQQVQWGGRTNGIREQIMSEVRELAAATETEFAHWTSSLPPDVAEAYGATPINVPLMGKLLRIFRYPDTDKLVSELRSGFQLAGELEDGVGWPPKLDKGPPLQMEDFKKDNDTYVRKQIASRKPSAQAQKLLDELYSERGLGRVRGPFEPPSKWGSDTFDHNPRPSAPCEGASSGPVLRPRPKDEECYPSFAFPIIQIGSDQHQKVRRGEDWKRSFHNGLATASSKPIHYSIDHHFHLICELTEAGLTTAKTWGQDHEGAYRQLPAGPPEINWVLLRTERGWTLWQHLVALFGSRAAVWIYNRFADAIMHIGRVILAVPVLHYVDDFSGVDPGDVADSGFDCFEELSGLLNIKLKYSKRQKPESKRELLGVVLGVEDRTATVFPRPDRREKLTKYIEEALEQNRLRAAEAEQLAGKIGFYQTAVFGRLGRAALRALYRRARFGGSTLTVDLRAALQAILFMLRHAPPRQICTVFREEPRPAMYADAFFEVDGVNRGFSYFDTNPKEKDKVNAKSRNGWGIVLVRRGHANICARGSLPRGVMAKMKSKKTFIFFLETLAQCLGAWLFEKELGDTYWAFIDNEGARYSLLKGYSRDQDANAIISLFWGHAAMCKTAPWFERVPSAAQLADGVSRDDWELPFAQGWLRIEPNFDGIWDILFDMIGSGHIAGPTHIQAVRHWVKQQRREHPPMTVGLPVDSRSALEP